MERPPHLVQPISELASLLAVENVTPQDLVKVMWKHDLSDEDFTAACEAAVEVRRQVLEERNLALQARRAALVDKAATWGRKQAELEVLNKPLPWTREHFIEIADLAADHWISHFSNELEDGDKYSEDLVIDMAGTARNALVARVGELLAILPPASAETGRRKN